MPPRGILDCIPRKLAAADSRLTQRGHWDCHTQTYNEQNYTICFGIYQLKLFKDKVRYTTHLGSPEMYASEWLNTGGSIYCTGDKIEKNEMGWACGAYGWGEGVYRVLLGKPEGRRSLGRPKRKWVDNIRIDLQEVGCGYMDWIGLAQDRDR